MGWFESNKEQRDQVFDNGGYGAKDGEKPKFSHELIAGAASFEGFKLWEDHERKEGKPVKHALAKEMLAGIVGGEAEKFVEAHKLERDEATRLKEQAVFNGHKMYNEHYGDNNDFDPNFGSHNGGYPNDPNRYQSGGYDNN